RRASMEPDPDPDAKGRRSRAGPGPVVAWPALGTAPRTVRTPPMIRLFGRKKPDHETADEDRSRTRTGERTGRYSIEELAAAFPDAGAVAAPVEPEQESAPPQPPPAQEPPAAPQPTGTPATRASVAVPSRESETALPSPASAELRASYPPSPAPEPPPATQAPVAPATAAPATPVAAAAPAPAAIAQPPAVAPPVPSAEAAATVPPAAPGKTGWRDRLRGSVFARSVGGLFSRNPKLDDDLLDEIETALITADVGVTATTQLVERLRKRMKAREFADARAMLAALRAELIAVLQPVARPLVIDQAARPFVILTVGVNGVGKTTTIGKLARRFKDEGRPLMLAAGDTFRAAAVAQLQAWGERNGVTVIAQGQDADPASVAFDALQAAKSRGSEVLIAD